jgi:hypothetical protein
VVKRPNNEGTIYFWEEKKLWVARVSLPNGKRKTKYGKTQKAVKEWLQGQREAIKGQNWIDTDTVTISEFLNAT